MRPFGRGVGAAVVLAGGLAVGGPVSVSAQAGPGSLVPVLEVSPLRVDPEEVVTFTVRDCPQQPELQVGESDFVRLVEPTPTSVAGTWSSELVAGLTDWTVHGTCGAVAFDEVVVDIDHPLMSFLPIGAFAPSPDPPTTVYGSDCPDGTTATVTFADEAKGYRSVETAAIDERGDWQVSPQHPVAGQVSSVDLRITVGASCGDVTYAPLRYDLLLGIPGGPNEPPTSTPTPPAVAEPPPAVARSGRATFTG